MHGKPIGLICLFCLLIGALTTRQLVAQDCNNNGVPDVQDIDPADPDGNGEVSLDDNNDNIPDECQFKTVVERVVPCGSIYIPQDFVANNTLTSVFVFNRNLELVGEIYENQIRYGGGTISPTLDGRLLVSDWTGDRIQILDPNGIASPQLINTGGLNGAHGAVVNEEGQFIVNSYLSDSIKLYAPNGDYLQNIGANIEDPQCLAIDRAGNLFVGNRNNGNGFIAMFDENLNHVQNFGQGLFNPHPTDMAFGLNGILYVAAPDQVLKFAPGGIFIGSIVHPGMQPHGLAFDETGTLWVTETSGTNIFRFDSNEVFIDENTLDFASAGGTGNVIHGLMFRSGSADDCNNNQIGDSCEIADGLVDDCNDNGIPDSCDVAAVDCNGNGIPDECDEDCNLDGVADDCQLTGNDCNANNVPDDCELDCNGNGIPDDCDIANCAMGDTSCSDCDGNGALDVCELSPVNLGSIRFDGLNDYVRIPRQALLEPDAITVELWARLDGIQSRNTKLVRKTLNNLPGYSIAADFNNARRMRFDCDSSVVDTQTHDAYVGSWHHFAGTYEDGTARFFVDGELVSTSIAASGPLSHSASDLYIAAGLPSSDTSEYFKGELDEVRIWNRARTPEEIAADYQRVINPNADGLIGSWRFETGSGQQVVDDSPNALNGTFGFGTFNEGADPQWATIAAPTIVNDCNNNGRLDSCDVAGDANGDDILDLADLSSFVDAVLAGSGCAFHDVNVDGSIDGRDVPLFTALLLQ